MKAFQCIYPILRSGGIVVFLVGIPGIIDDIETWKRWLSMFDNYSTNVAFMLAGILIFVLPDYIQRFIAKPLLARKRRKLRARVFKVEAMGIIGSYFKDAKTDPHFRDLVIAGEILDRFDKACPEAIDEEGIYNADTLEEWIRANAIKLLIAHRSEL